MFVGVSSGLGGLGNIEDWVLRDLDTWWREVVSGGNGVFSM